MSNKNLDPHTFSISTATRSELSAARRKPWFNDLLRHEVISKGFWQPSENEAEDQKQLTIVSEQLIEVYAQLNSLQNEAKQQRALKKATYEHQKLHEKRLAD